VLGLVFCLLVLTACTAFAEGEKKPTLGDVMIPIPELMAMFNEKQAQILLKQRELKELEAEADRILAIIRYQRQAEDRLKKALEE